MTEQIPTYLLPHVNQNQTSIYLKSGTKFDFNECPDELKEKLGSEYTKTDQQEYDDFQDAQEFFAQVQTIACPKSLQGYVETWKNQILHDIKENASYDQESMLIDFVEEWVDKSRQSPDPQNSLWLFRENTGKEIDVLVQEYREKNPPPWPTIYEYYALRLKGEQIFIRL